LRNYEILYIVDPKLEAEDYTALNDKITNLIAVGGGEVVGIDDWGSRRLSYRIGDLKEGRYALVKFRAVPENVRGLDRQLRLLQRVVRYIIVRQEG